MGPLPFTYTKRVRGTAVRYAVVQYEIPGANRNSRRIVGEKNRSQGFPEIAIL
jgi:hypothetical protein